MAKNKEFEASYQAERKRREYIRKDKRATQHRINIQRYGRSSEAKCPYCGGRRVWCTCCEVWSSICCCEYGTCQCS